VKRRTEITIESSRLMIIRQVDSAPRVSCQVCNERIEMVTPDHAASLFRLSTRIIHRMIEDGKVHFRESSDGSLLICPNSISLNGSEEIFQ
jgi:hypothetical protein